MPASPSPRVQPFYCPYCGEEDFVPSGPLEGADDEYHCHSCDRRYQVRYRGLGESHPGQVGPPGQ